MITNKLSMMAPTTFCDKCHTILAVNFDYKNSVPKWDRITKKGDHNQGKFYDFCDERCRMIFFRGRKYWTKKLEHQHKNWTDKGYLIER